jgi:predicted DsbA family dithiol-disulfide isomerase
MVHFPLHPETPPQGQTLAEMFGPSKNIEEMNKNMQNLMKQEGLPYEDRTMTYNSRLAQELGTWADTQKNGYSIHEKIYQAYFVQNKNIGSIKVLLDIANNLKLNENKAKEVLNKRTFKEVVDSDWSKARQNGVTGVPTYIAAGAGVVGAQPYEALVQLVEHAMGQSIKS